MLGLAVPGALVGVADPAGVAADVGAAGTGVALGMALDSGAGVWLGLGVACGFAVGGGTTVVVKLAQRYSRSVSPDAMTLAAISLPT